MQLDKGQETGALSIDAVIVDEFVARAAGAVGRYSSVGVGNAGNGIRLGMLAVTGKAVASGWDVEV